jgi:cytochrome P450
MSEAASPTALRFACRLIGVPEIATDAYDSIFVRVTRAMDSSLDASRQLPGIEATHELNDLLLRAQSSAAPGSMIYELNQVSSVREMSGGYVRNTIAAMFNAAYSTAHTSMGSFLVLAFERPGIAKRIVESGLVAEGVQELLRFTSPAQATMRYSAHDTVIRGVRIRKTDPIVTLMAAANRDSEQFENPDDLVLDRSPNPHLGFGQGPHFCIGAMPAQAFLGHFVRHLATWESELTLAGQPTWLDTATLRCLHRLPVARLKQSASGTSVRSS